VIDDKFEGEESFADLFEESLKTKRKTVAPGEKVTGTVVQVGAERAIVDLGGGQDGMIELAELAEKGEKATVKVGDRVEAYVVRIENRNAILAKSLGKGPGARAALEEAARTGVPVDGHITGVNKGGYEVEVAGTRCFCPLGQMDIRRIEDPATMIGQKLQFRIQEFRGSRDIVLSRRALLEAEQAEKAKATRANLQVGVRFTGVVTNVRDFGAFVDIGGLEGLVPVSELSYGRVRPSDVVSAGQQVEVEVIRIEPPGPKDRSERITLSMKALGQDPWTETVSDLPEGSIVRGTVVRIQPFGAFVEIVPGVDGLVHVSAFGKRIAHPSNVVNVGDSVAVRVDAVDLGQRRISLTYVPPEEIADITGEPVPAEPTPMEEPPKLQRDVSDQAAGMRVRRTEKPVEAKPAPAAASKPAAAKPAVIGRQAPAAAAPSAEGAPAPVARNKVGDVVDVTVDKIEAFGLFVKWGNNRGLIPARELETPKGTDLKKAFPVGSTLKAAISEIRPDGKMNLSAKEVSAAEERAEAQSWMQTQKPATGGGKQGFGTLGDLLKKFGK
jgi:small subunit ribosomal protein S1